MKLERLPPGEWDRARLLWLEVGRGFWTARTRWSSQRWRQHLGEPTVHFWVAGDGSGDAGFFELITQRRAIKVEGFGLLPARRGSGHGGPLLAAATSTAFALGASRVRLHTATDDHPHALPNYFARGFTVRQERVLKNPMPGAVAQ